MFRSSTDHSYVNLGESVATVLNKCWRDTAFGSVGSKITLEIIQLLLASGCGALVWNLLHDTNRNAENEFPQLIQASRFNIIRDAVNTKSLGLLFTRLQEQNLSPILGKGWAIARLYPKPGLRPYTDFDLYTKPQDFDVIQKIITLPDAMHVYIDLHKGIDELDDRPFDEVFKRTQLVSTGSAAIRVFGPEDHLRLMATHMLGHGAWRPLWLCDIAVAFEKRPGNFDWNYFLSGDERRTDYVICAIGLAHQLLGANIEGTPIESRAKKLPPWLVSTVLKQWGRGQNPHGARTPIKHYLQNPSGLLDALRMRWPNGIEATVDLHGRFNNFPRLPYQVADCFVRTGRFLRSL